MLYRTHTHACAHVHTGALTPSSEPLLIWSKGIRARRRAGKPGDSPRPGPCAQARRGRIVRVARAPPPPSRLDYSVRSCVVGSAP